MSNKVLVIGAVNIDIFAHTDKPYQLEDSNLAKINLGFGGVGGNIANNLNNLGLETHFITAFSEDLLGDFAKSYYLKSGINIEHAITTHTENSSVYLGVMDEENDLFLGLNDMALINKIDKEFLLEKESFIKSFEYIVIDNNLNEETLNYLIHTYQDKTIIMDAVSAKKVKKIENLLDKIDILKLNQIELNVLSTNTTVEDKIKDLLNKGLKEILVTNKDKPVFYGKENKVLMFPTYTCNNVVNASGAGDAFISGYTYALINNLSLDERIDHAMKLANKTLQVKTSVVERVK